jgi:hypothetical protein
MLRRKPKAPPGPLAHVDAATLPPRWAPAVADAVAARRRWLDLVAGVRPGPLRDRLAQLGARVDDGVLAVWDTAVRAVEAERVTQALDADRVVDEYKRAKRDPAADPALVEALHARFTSVQRVLNSVEDTARQLQLLEARLGAAVARAAEVALVAGSGGRDAEALGEELDAVVGELGALRDSLDALG